MFILYSINLLSLFNMHMLAKLTFTSSCRDKQWKDHFLAGKSLWGKLANRKGQVKELHVNVAI